MQDKIDLVVEDKPKDFDVSALKYPRDLYDLISVDHVERYKLAYYKRITNSGKLAEYFTNHTQVLITLRCKRCGTIKQVKDSSKICCNKGPCNTNCKDLTGKRIGKLTVLSYEFVSYRKDGKSNWYWKCECDCGKQCYKTSHALLNTGTIECPSCAVRRRTCSLMLGNGGSAWNSAYRTTKNNADKRHLAFTLTMNQFRSICQLPCHYCGADPGIPLRSGKNGHTLVGYRNGIDRVDNTKGYSADNCVSCCYTCNSMKSDNDLNTWLAHMEQIINHCKERSTTIPEGSTPKRVETDSEDVSTL